MIAFNKKSWHYRLAYELFSFKPEANFCVHWRRVLASIFFSLLGIFLGLCALGAPYGWLVMGKAYVIPLGTAPFLLLGSLVWVFGLIIACIFIGILVYDFYDEHLRKDPKPNKSPGLVKTWIESKKHKYCPAIEFVDYE